MGRAVDGRRRRVISAIVVRGRRTWRHRQFCARVGRQIATPAFLAPSRTNSRAAPFVFHMKMAERQRLRFDRLAKLFAQCRGQPRMVKGRLPCLLLRVDQDEFVPSGHSSAIDEAICPFNPLNLIRQVEHQTFDTSPGGSARVVVGRNTARTHPGRQRGQWQEKGRQGRIAGKASAPEEREQSSSNLRHCIGNESFRRKIRIRQEHGSIAAVSDAWAQEIAARSSQRGNGARERPAAGHLNSPSRR